MAEDRKPAPVPPTVRPLRIVLYVLTVVTAAAALFLQPALAGAVQRGALGPGWLFIPLGIYAVFFFVYAADRYFLVRRRQYPAGRAFFQVAFGVLFGLLLLPSTIGDWNAQRPDGVKRLLEHRDPAIRRVTVEALGYRGPSLEHARALRARLDDKDSEVRARAARILSAWSGTDAGNPEAIDAWIESGALPTTRTATASGG